MTGACCVFKFLQNQCGRETFDEFSDWNLRFKIPPAQSRSQALFPQRQVKADWKESLGTRLPPAYFGRGIWRCNVKTERTSSRMRTQIRYSTISDPLGVKRYFVGRVYKTRTGSDQIGSDRIDKTRTGSDRINKTWIGLRPTDKTLTGSENKSDRHKFPPKWSRNISWSSFGLEIPLPFFAAQWSKDNGSFSYKIFHRRPKLTTQYSAANDLRPQMIPRPEMILKLDHKWSRTVNEGWRMVNARLCETARLAFFFASPRHFDFLDCETETSKCFECERETFRLSQNSSSRFGWELWEWARRSLHRSLTKEPFVVKPCTRHQIWKYTLLLSWPWPDFRLGGCA